MASSMTQGDKEAIGTRFTGGRMDTPRTEEVKDNLSDAGSSLRQAAAVAIPAAQEQLQRMSENVAQTTESFETYLTECIRDKPLTSILIAAAAGAVAGALLIRR